MKYINQYKPLRHVLTAFIILGELIPTNISNRRKGRIKQYNSK